MRLLLPALFLLVLAVMPARAEPAAPREDNIAFDLTAEGWAVSKTALAIVNVEAAVGDKGAGALRADLTKAVNDMAPGEWRLTALNRSQDQAAVEHWSATFEARLPENQLNGLSEAAKKQSKPGMQLTLADLVFTPTLDEIEAERNQLRRQIYKDATEQLTSLNSAFPGRAYRIAMINFTGDTALDETAVMPQVFRGPQLMMKAMTAASPANSAAGPGSIERFQKVRVTGRVIYAALAGGGPAVAVTTAPVSFMPMPTLKAAAQPAAPAPVSVPVPAPASENETGETKHP